MRMSDCPRLNHVHSWSNEHGRQFQRKRSHELSDVGTAVGHFFLFNSLLMKEGSIFCLSINYFERKIGEAKNVKYKEGAEFMSNQTTKR